MASLVKIGLLVLAVGTLWLFQAYMRSAQIALPEVDPAETSVFRKATVVSEDQGEKIRARHRVEAKQGSGLASPRTEKLNINKATAQEFETLPGIGPKLAEAIIRFRDEQGDFKTLEQLKEVRGIGEKRFTAVSEFLTIDEGPEDSLQK